jgi:hypothetical protein
MPAKSISNIEKSEQKRGRGRPRSNATPILLRVHPGQLAQIDAWMRKSEVRSRPEAIRRLLEKALKQPKIRKP